MKNPLTALPTSFPFLLLLPLFAGLAMAQSAAAQADAAQADTARPGGKLAGNPAVELVKIADGFIDPVNVACPRDGSGRIMVIERQGTVRLIKDGELQKRPFLDISDTVVSSFLEQGLYDLEFHPKFAENGKFYVHYSDMWFNGDSFIVEYKVDAKKPDRADPETARVIMQIEQPYCNHNGGEIVFGPDGYLYIGSGDGGWEGDVLSVGQDLSSLLGKVLRIDVDKSTPGKNYAIPETNPFVYKPTLMVLFGVSEEAFSKIHPKAKPEIWAYGLRNPWKMQFDSKTKDLYIAEVGQNHWEEINMQPGDSTGGENYGWKFMCGTQPFPLPLNDKGLPDSEAVKDAPRVGVMPIAEYSHVTDGICVTGIGVSRNKNAPSLEGIYFFGDWGSGKLWGTKRDSNGKWQMQELLDTKLMFTGAGEGEDGTLYVTDATANYGGPVKPSENEPGAVWKIVPKDKVPADAETASVE